MLGRPKFKANGVEYLVLPTKATSQNIKFEKDGNTWYVPLVSGTAGSFATENGKNFKLGYLKVGDKYGVVDVGSIPTITIEHQPYHVRQGKIYPINPLVFTINDTDNNKMNVVLSSNRLHYGSTALTENKTWSNKGNVTLEYSGVVWQMDTNPLITVVITATNTKNGVGTKSITNLSSVSKKDNFDHRLYWVDNRTRYTGTYNSSTDTMTITGHANSNTPYQQYTGFDEDDEGLTVKWDIYNESGESVKAQWTAQCSSVFNNPVITYMDGWNDITTGTESSHKYGVKLCEGWVPNGEYDLVIVVDGSPSRVRDYGMHINMIDPNNPAGKISDV